MKQTYFVVVSADSIIMRVFGPKDEAVAQAHARRVSRPGQTFYVEKVVKAIRPLLGNRLFSRG